MLRHIPAGQLEAAIDGLDISPDNLMRRGFLQAVAATAVVALAGGAAGGCEVDGEYRYIDAGPSADVPNPDLATDASPVETAPDAAAPGLPRDSSVDLPVGQDISAGILPD